MNSKKALMSLKIKLNINKKTKKFLIKRNLNLPKPEAILRKSKILKDNKLFSCRLNDKYRIIWIWDKINEIIKIIKINNRDNIYKQI